MSKLIRKPLKLIARPMVAAFLWSNRRDVARWAGFVHRTAMPATRSSRADIALEARVRWSLSSDQVLRGDPSLRDLRIHDGVVVLESPALWHNKALAINRISQVSGVESVHTATDVNEQNWLDVDVMDVDAVPASA